MGTEAAGHLRIRQRAKETPRKEKVRFVIISPDEASTAIDRLRLEQSPDDAAAAYGRWAKHPSGAGFASKIGQVPCAQNLAIRRGGMRKFIIMGVQGCGKGTQAKLMAKDFDLTHICVGDIFRWHLQSHTKLGARIGRFTAAGELVPDEIVEEIVRGRLDQHDWNFGFILDGFPRNRRQAEFFLESYDIDAVIHLDLPDQIVMQRVLNRRLCGTCGLDYNLIFHRPQVADVCDVCGGQLVARADDTPEALKSRLRDYHGKTAPILDLFSHKELVVSVDATQSAAAVQAEIRDRLGLSCETPAPRVAPTAAALASGASIPPRLHSAATWAPFSVTERFIKKTKGTRANARNALTAKMSKYASDEACWSRISARACKAICCEPAGSPVWLRKKALAWARKSATSGFNGSRNSLTRRV